MCGIAGIIVKQQNSVDIKAKVDLMTKTISHRGPDGEGFLLAGPELVLPLSGKDTPQFSDRLSFLPQQHLSEVPGDFNLAFGHRRLSIIDLSESGHQPMSLPGEKLWITYNGEIYNYIELKKELQQAGYTFLTESDTEVILVAYTHWGPDCVKKFNGMWAFCIYDREKNTCFASRDRLGVKPFYYVNNDSFFAFASEQKAFVRSGLLKAEIRKKALHGYLVNGLLEDETKNFFDGVEELFPGNNLYYDLSNGKVSTEKYYSIQFTNANDNVSEAELIEKIRARLCRTVELRLRSDVEVGTCLSGGIDSSVLSGLMYEILDKEIYCFTSVFKGESFNEESFADKVAQRIKAKHKKIQPDENGFITDLDDLIYSQDVPIWDTSTYAQFSVMKLAKANNIKVVLDGQGADELFAGYHHHFVAKWNNLFSGGRRMEAIRDIQAAAKTIHNPFVFYAKETIKQRKHLGASLHRKFYKNDFVQAYPVNNPVAYFNSVNEQLRNDIEQTRLKAFLKCEDRCGMWHSVESRTPFSDDVELVDLMFSFNGNKKIKDGVLKHLLRESCKHVLPNEIYSRYDKRGFETPMHKWLKALKPQITEEILAANWDFVKAGDLQKIHPENFGAMKMLFKLFVLTRWKKVFDA